MEWYIHISAENGADLILIEKGVWILGSFLQCPTFRTEAELCLGQKSTCPFTPNNLLRIGSTWDQPGTGLDAESANHTQRLSPPCCGMWSKSQQSAGVFYSLRLWSSFIVCHMRSCFVFCGKQCVCMLPSWLLHCSTEPFGFILSLKCFCGSFFTSCLCQQEYTFKMHSVSRSLLLFFVEVISFIAIKFIFDKKLKIFELQGWNRYLIF